jgi:transcriptional regulator with XRE-family HTH domain
MGAQRSRGLLATSEGARLLDKRRRDKNWTLEQVAERSEVSIDVVGKLFNPYRGKPTDRSKIEQIARVLELEPKEFIDPDEWVPPVKGKKKSGFGSIEWHSVFLARLVRQEKQRLLRQAATEQGFELNVFVPLGLVERKQQPRSQKSPQMLEQETIVKRYEHDEFLRQVIGLGTRGKHIAIIGEPGAGKTTILSKVAQFIRNEEKASPIYISLGGLKGKSLSEFLLEEWLPEALAVVDADCTEVEQKQFEKFLRGGDVWLLLDGVDEIANLTPLKALAEVRSLPLDWQVRVVVTCRSNVWDASLNNGMQGFETYRTQEFADKDVEKFIQDWFAQAGHLERGEKLIEKLREPRREGIFRLVRSPLCNTPDRFQGAKAPYWRRMG